MKDTHPTHQKAFYIGCWVILAALIVVATTKLIGG
jgi:hypothetical protein